MRQPMRKKGWKRAACLLTAMAMWLSMLPASHAASVDDVQVASAPLTSRSSAANGMVRVYLSSLGNPSTLNLTVVGNYSISVTGAFLSSGSELTIGFDRSTGAITLTHNGVKTNMGSSFSLRRHSASGTNGIKIRQARESNNPYPGDLSFHAVSNGGGYTLYTIAHIYIENYLYGVLPYEMGNSTNIEALKAQAVAARTYTVRMMQSRASGLYDVKDTTSDQVYRGTPSGNANCVEAVNATKGIVLMYGSSYITTYYSASNGGQTEISRSGGSYAYMKVKDDPFDYANPSSTVKKKTIYTDLSNPANNAQLISLLKTKAVSRLVSMGYAASQNNTTLVTLKSITPHTPMYASPSRLYTKMDFVLTANTQGAAGVSVTVTCDIFNELESLLSMGIQSLSNELWSVTKTATSFVLEARRYGHGMGMSQRGAMYMAKLGYRYDQILGFYYEGCQRVQHSFTNSILSAGSSDQQITVEPPADLDELPDGACKGTVKLISAKATLAIRNGKSDSAALIGAIGNGAIVDVLANDGAWCFIRFGEMKGYVPTNALVITGTPSGTEEVPSSIAGFATVTASDFVNLRAQPSMSGKVVSTAPAGAVLTVFSQSGGWAKVQYNATVAYANTSFLSQVTSSYPTLTVSSGSASASVHTQDGQAASLWAAASTNAQTLARLLPGTEVNVESDDGSWCKVNYNGMAGYMLTEALDFTGGADIAQPSVPSEPETPQQPGAEEAPSTPAGKLAVVTTEYGSLNMRAQPRAGSQILTTIPRGTQIEITEAGTAWCGVRYNGLSGYVMTSFLTFADGASPLPETPQGGAYATVTTQSGSLNLRAQPRSGSDILLRIPQYAAVTVQERGGEWSRVTYQGTTGYAMSVFLTFSDEAPEPPGQPEQPDAGDSPLPGQVPDTPDADDPDEPITQSPGSEDALYAVVTTASGSLNLRRDALPGSAVIARIPKGTTIVISERMAVWSKTSYAGYEGYVMNAYLTFQNGRPEVIEGETAVVVTPSGTLNLRLEPSRNAGVIAHIPQYASVNVQQRGNDWCYIAYEGLLGYVMTDFLSFSTQAQPPASNTPETPSDGEDGDHTPVSQPDVSAAMTAYVSTASGSLNLREQPGSGERVIKTIPRNAAVTVVSYGEPWCQVLYSGVEGYVMTNFLRFEGTPAIPQEPDVGEDEADSPAQDTSQSPVEQPEKTPAEGEGTAAWVSTPSGSLNLREASDAGSRVIASIPRHAQVKVFSQSGAWSYVQYQERYGYVMSKYLSAANPAGAEGGAQGAATDQVQAPEHTAQNGGMVLDVTLRAPDSATYANAASSIALWPMCEESGQALADIQMGEQVEIILQGDSWCLVQYQSMQGYCLTRNLQVISQ
ncbi:MAG: SH3 domain-containing protein [Clostridiales bacterium]|nr:SH3 domain-containing protein [Clostridiales bacterium]MDO4349912.1 SH3 domain-containing protein [Eubacteriales bacterium]MDY4008362.1 SH3 domain-containing protein [Candidatus Limiplasma sp.]